MTPREAHNHSHSQPLTLKSQASTYVGQTTQPCRDLVTKCFSRSVRFSLASRTCRYAQETQLYQREVALRTDCVRNVAGRLHGLQPGFVFACGGVSWWNHQKGARGGCLGERPEIYFHESCVEKIFPLSAASALRCSASTSPAKRSHRVSANPTKARFGSPTSTSRARRLLPMKRSWPCLTSSGRVSGHDRSAA